MLPFLIKPKKAEGGVITELRKPDKEEHMESESGMHSAAQDIMDAISTGDVKKLAGALLAAFQIADSMPHEEGEHIEESEE